MNKVNKIKSHNPHIGISEEGVVKIVDNLNILLADTYTLYLNTHNFHWNVTGPMFNSLHTMFMDQYTELWNAIDVVAERIRSLGYYAPGSYTSFSKLTSLKEAPEDHISAEEMIKILIHGHNTIASSIRAFFPIVEEYADQSTADVITQRLDIHEKTSWMLNSVLAE